MIIKNFKKIKNFRLKATLGENVRDTIIEAGKKALEESAYGAGNNTDEIIKIAKRLEKGIDLGTKLGLGGESIGSLGRIGFKATTDIKRGDVVCTGLCAVSGTCETIALGCTLIKFIPYRGDVYVYAKLISIGCMSYRNLCSGEGC